MDQLIFFSIPGLVFGLSIIGIFSPSITTKENLVIFALLIPLAGYILHQTYRLIFEWTGGFGRKSREVVTFIQEDLDPQLPLSISREDAFLVWEITIYDTKEFSGFLAHDARSFHFTLAFWSTTFAAAIGVITTLLFFFFQKDILNVYFSPLKFWIGLFQLIIAIIFFIRGKNVYKSINEQEVAFLKKNKEVFTDSMKKIFRDSTQTKPTISNEKKNRIFMFFWG